MSRRTLARLGLSAFAAALALIFTAIWITDGWMTSQRLLASAALLALIAVTAWAGSLP